MPAAANIIEGLHRAANQAIGVAIGWHVVTLLALVGLALRWRPSRANAGALLATPVASASAVAFTLGNPFNGGLLGALAMALFGFAWRLGSARATRGTLPTAVVGAAMITFGWTYPHFLESRPSVTYLFAAPMGVIPCPTLSLVIGFALLGGGLGSRAWSLALSIVGLFYGAFGVARLGVHLDLALVAGAATLLVTAQRMRP